MTKFDKEKSQLGKQTEFILKNLRGGGRIDYRWK